MEAKNFPQRGSPVWIPEVWSLELMKHKPIQFGLNLWKKRFGIMNRRLRAKNSQLLKSYFHDFYGFIVKNVYRIVFPSDVCLLWKNVRKIAAKLLRSQGMEVHLVAFVVKRVSISQKYSQQQSKC